MPVAAGLLQQGLAVSVCDIEVCAIDNQSLRNFFQTRVGSEVERVVSGIYVY
jgi:hypothetical protein